MLICLLFIGITYSFFQMVGQNNREEVISTKAGSIEIIFDDGDNGINASLNFGESIDKKFTLENTETLPGSVKLSWLNLINNYCNGSLTYELTYSKEEDGEYSVLVPNTNVPVADSFIQQSLSDEISVAAKDKYYFNLKITLNYLEDVDQTEDLNSTFQTEFTISDAEKYIYYDLVVDPNGGTWNDFTSIREYKLKSGENISIDDPTRIGCTFNGWILNGEASVIDSKVFTMGIENSSLVADWIINKYHLTVNIDEHEDVREVEYGSVVELDIPVKEGHTFIGWDVSGGTLDGNSIKIDKESDVTVRAKFKINNYKYIVYHKKMNVDGNGYSLVDADTLEEEAQYNTIVNPAVNSYTGFMSPEMQELLIKEEVVYPPILNKIEYNYERNKYKYSINANGGTYSGTTSGEMYYEQTMSLNIPALNGYNFTNWTLSSGEVYDNIFKMGLSDATLTANYDPKEFTVTFNANGGTTPTGSKTVLYDSTYGSLPTPSYNKNFLFQGWFTARNGGVQVTEETKVNLSSNQTLYAHWYEYGLVPKLVNAVHDKTTIPSHSSIHTSGSPTFSNKATTDEGIYKMSDDYGTSYYFRGAVTNNYVKFGKWNQNLYVGYYNTAHDDYHLYDSLSACQSASSFNIDCQVRYLSGKDMYWRVIRVNGDGSLRMIYDGTSAHSNGEISRDRTALTDVYFNNYSNDNKYVGYMYAPSGTTASSSKSQAQTNTVNSTIKSRLESWYQTNIYNSGLDSNISDAIFCTDRTTPGSSVTGWSSDTGYGYSTYSTLYGAFGRIGYKQSVLKPSFVCPQKNDAFTKSDTTKGNGKLSHKVGLITGDEIVAAGSGPFNGTNQSYYLYKGIFYWGMTPYGLANTGEALMFVVDNVGSFYGTNVNMAGPLVPVINLSPEYAGSMLGSGSMSDPYHK